MTPSGRLTAATLAVAACVWMIFPAPLQAQVRRGRVVVGRPPVVLRASYRPFYRPYYGPFYRPYYRPFVYDTWYYPYGWYAPFSYAPVGQIDSSLRLQVSPRETEVFVDGYFAGTVDQFDGTFQRLHLEPGEHDIVLYLQGHRSEQRKIYLQPGGTFRIRHSMEPLAPGAAQEPRPVGTPFRSERRRGVPPEAARAPQAPQAPQAAAAENFGTLALRVQPGDAEVLIDDERWEGPAIDQQLVLQIASGRHRLEIRRDGYRPYRSEVEVQSGETATVNVSLPRE